MSTRIDWIDQDASILSLTHAELLQASMEWNARRSPEQPWLAIAKPTSIAEQYFTLSLSLDAYRRYTDAVLQGFVAECEALQSACTPEEVDQLRTEEVSKGNVGRLYEAKARVLRVHVPKRLVPAAKARMEALFADGAHRTTEQAEAD
jgi:hypothetical protein